MAHIETWARTNRGALNGAGGALTCFLQRGARRSRFAYVSRPKRKWKERKIYRTNTRARLQILAIDIAGEAYYVLTIKLLPSSPLFLSPLAVS